MAWLVVDEDGYEFVHELKPERCGGNWVQGRDEVNLPNGSIEKLIGRDLTWEDEPVKLT